MHNQFHVGPGTPFSVRHWKCTDLKHFVCIDPERIPGFRTLPDVCGEDQVGVVFSDGGETFKLFTSYGGASVDMAVFYDDAVEAGTFFLDGHGSLRF